MDSLNTLGIWIGGIVVVGIAVFGLVVARELLRTWWGVVREERRGRRRR